MAEFLALPLMGIEILIAHFLFGALLEKRKPFFPRALISATLLVAVIFLAELLYYVATGSIFSYNGAATFSDSVFKFVLYISIFVLTVLAVAFCYRNSVWVILFYCAAGYAAQHLSANLGLLLRLIPGYAAYAAAFPWVPPVAEIIICSIVYSAVYFFLVRGKILPENDKEVRRKVLFSLSVIVIGVGISRLSLDDASRGPVAFLCETLSAVVICILILALHFNLTQNDRMHSEVAILEELLHRENEQYKLSKENIELINIKCHDLKHQISALRNCASEEQLSELEEAVMIYDSAVKTGNDVLDVILTEKMLYCEKNKIRLTCMAEGDLGFMDSMDLYSLFGNALSNAIESVRGITDEDRRCIALNIREIGQILSVHVTNFYDGEILFENGLPVSMKGSDYHGYGVKSMRYIAEKYGGYIHITAENGVFALDLVFPACEKRQKKETP